ENKASTVALCRLFQHSLSDPNSPQNGGASGDLALINLHRIEVSCDDMTTNAATGAAEVPSSAIRTRSKADQEAKSGTANRKVPSTVKILKLLLNEYNHLQE